MVNVGLIVRNLFRIHPALLRLLCGFFLNLIMFICIFNIQAMKVSPCVFRFLALFIMVISLYGLLFAINKIEDLDPTRNQVTNQIETSNVSTLLIVCNNPSRYVFESKNFLTASSFESVSQILVWVLESEDIENEKYLFIRNISNHLKVSTTVTFVSDYLSKASNALKNKFDNEDQIRSTGIDLSNIDMVIIDGELHPMVQNAFLQYIDQDYDFIVTQKVEGTEAMNNYRLKPESNECQILFKEAIIKSGVNFFHKSSNVNNLLLSLKLKSLQPLVSPIQTLPFSKWLGLRSISTIQVPYMRQQSQQEEILKILIGLMAHSRNLTIRVKQKELQKKIVRNSVINDLQSNVQLSQKEQSINWKDNSLVALYNLKVFLKNLDGLRLQIISLKAKVIIYVQEAEKDSLQNLKNEFLITKIDQRLIKELLNSPATIEHRIQGRGLYLIEKASKVEKFKNIVSENKSINGFQFSDDSLWPFWSKTSLEKYRGSSCFQAKYPKYFIEEEKIPGKDLIQYLLQLKITNVSVLWCLSSNHELFYLIGRSNFIQKIHFCPNFEKLALKERKKIAILNDFDLKIMQTAAEEKNYDLAIQQREDLTIKTKITVVKNLNQCNGKVVGSYCVHENISK